MADQTANEFPPSKNPDQIKEPSSKEKDRSMRKGLLLGGVLIFILLIFGFAIAASQGGQNQLVQALGMEGDIQGIIVNVVNLIFGAADIAAIIAIVIGVFVYIAALGDPKEIKRGKHILVFSVISLVVVSLFWLITITFLNTGEIDTGPVKSDRLILTNPSPPECPAPCMINYDVTGISNTGYFFDWDFGDGSKGTGKIISHEYKEQGIQTVTVKIIDSDSNEVDLLRTNIFINNALPKPKIFADPISGRAPLKVSFDASESSDDDGILKYEWDFGDPTYSSDTNNNAATGEIATHNYTKNGTYTVRLTVSDTNNQEQSTSQTIEVGQAPDIPTAVISTTPALDTSTDPYSIKGTAPLKVSFSGGKSRDSDGSVIEYIWDFGDGSTSEKAKTATHTYEELGAYSVSLTVIDNDQKEDSQTVQVFVIEPPKLPLAKISSIPDINDKEVIVGDNPMTVDVDGFESNDSDGNIVEYRWNFGDESKIITGQTATHIYTRAGEYTLSLTVIDNEGLESEEAQVTVRVTEPGPESPIASFVTDPNPASGNVPFTVTFDAASSYDPDGNIISHEWDFGDGQSVLGGSQISHVYSSPGIYTVKLIVHDDDGLTGEKEKPIAAHLPKPVAAISVNRDHGDVPLTVYFNASNSTGNITNYSWTFGDGTVDQGREVEHTYTASGEYTVTLRVKDTTEQIDMDTLTVIAE